MINWSLENLDIQLHLKLFFTNESNWSASSENVNHQLTWWKTVMDIFIYLKIIYMNINLLHTYPPYMSQTKTLCSTGTQKEWQCVKILSKCWIMSGEDFENVSFIKVLASSFSTISCFFQFKVNDNQFIQEEWTLFSKPHVKDKK